MKLGIWKVIRKLRAIRKLIETVRSLIEYLIKNFSGNQELIKFCDDIQGCIKEILGD